ncbi:hypothetical protein [Arthrobacter sp. MMS18-M83]|uniref:hypothetical protein n=1 Tax=Arthrobacter sp. MMS18-M83 TaxID=2996261 RepID=UPI00227BACE2|nr:hypothetical protein [Arthrobacter sp. MMS18-M83]WAH97459.1 hypothetical protein OW521_00680 [Arthrobacter sp. MMS18-M83]
MADLLVQREIAEILPSLMKYPPLKTKDWAGLTPGDGLYVQRESQLLMRGTVDDMVPDGSIFWIWIDAGGGRIALHEDDEVRVWLAEEPAGSRIKRRFNCAAVTL